MGDSKVIMLSADLIAQLWRYQQKPGDLFHDDA
jgi:hypothetical protein